jgi:anion-transporting  ArsA/GET3 family ATPase
VEPTKFFTSSRVAIVAGKGGVGKTTVSAALARAAAMSGLSTLIIEVEGKSGLAATFDKTTLDYQQMVLAAGNGEGVAEVSARTVTPDDALIEYLRDHGLARLSKRLVASGLMEVVATAVPGIKDILVLGKVKQIERGTAGGQGPDAHFLILDAPAAGHAITFLQSARGLVDAVKGGPINAQATDVLNLLTDPARCQVMLVTLPEETPVNELVETAFSLEDKVGVSLGPVVVNGLYPERDGLDVDPVMAAAATGATLRPGEAEALSQAAEFRRHRMDLQRTQVARLADQLPLPQFRLPYLFNADLGLTEIDLLAQCLLDGIHTLDDLAPAHRP